MASKRIIRGYVLTMCLNALDPFLGHNRPVVIAVRQRPGYKGEWLTASDGRVRFSREDRRVFKTKKEATASYFD